MRLAASSGSTPLTSKEGSTFLNTLCIVREYNVSQSDASKTNGIDNFLPTASSHNGKSSLALPLACSSLLSWFLACIWKVLDGAITKLYQIVFLNLFIT